MTLSRIIDAPGEVSEFVRSRIGMTRYLNSARPFTQGLLEGYLSLVDQAGVQISGSTRAAMLAADVALPPVVQPDGFLADGFEQLRGRLLEAHATELADLRPVIQRLPVRAERKALTHQVEQELLALKDVLPGGVATPDPTLVKARTAHQVSYVLLFVVALLNIGLGWYLQSPGTVAIGAFLALLAVLVQRRSLVAVVIAAALLGVDGLLLLSAGPTMWLGLAVRVWIIVTISKGYKAIEQLAEGEAPRPVLDTGQRLDVALPPPALPASPPATASLEAAGPAPLAPTTVVQGVPDPADPEGFVHRCLTQEFEDGEETRTPQADQKLLNLVTGLNHQRYPLVINSGRTLLARFTDLDVPYRLIAAAHRANRQWLDSREVLTKGLENARRKSLLLADLGETEWQAGNMPAALYWWAQAAQCQTDTHNDSRAWMSLSRVANELGLAATRDAFQRYGDGQPTAPALWGVHWFGHPTVPPDPPQREMMRRVLEGLRYGLLPATPPAQPVVDVPVLLPQAWPPAPTEAAVEAPTVDSRPSSTPRTVRRGLVFGVAAGLTVGTLAAAAVLVAPRAGTEAAAPVATSAAAPAVIAATTPAAATTFGPLRLETVQRDQIGNAAGECFTEDFDQVDCTKKHSFEFFAFARIDTDTRPSDADIEGAALRFCTRAFRSYVGDPNAPVPAGMDYWYPFDDEEWNSGDRSISCHVESDPPTKGSVRDR